MIHFIQYIYHGIMYVSSHSRSKVVFKSGIHIREQLLEHRINKHLYSELHQLIKVLFPRDHQQSAPGETNPINHIKNNSCGFSRGLIYLH
jgi:hypothetical protein